MSLTSGTRLGPYEIASQVGAGGMGEVYKATDTRLNRTVAIKVLPEHLASDPQRLARFQREAQTISSLNHPHICALHDVGDENGTHFLVMEYVEGEALDQRLEKGPVPLDDALEYAKQIADALEKAHQQGIVHRDLKPANVMITKSGVKLIDFGLVHLTAESASGSPLTNMPTQGDSDLTAEGTILGTFRYMAPEQVEGQQVDSRTDIYALCLVIYEMITGKKAIDGKTQASLIAAILKDKPQPLTELQPITPPQLDRVVQTGLEKDPENRWQSAREVKHALEWIGMETPAAPVPVVEAKQSSAWKVATAVLVLVVFAVVWVMWPTRALTPETFVSQVPIPGGASFTAASQAVISPDGLKLAFNTVGGDVGLWVQDLSSPDAPRPIPNTVGATSIFWSPESQWIGFAVGNTLQKVNIAGGTPQILAELPANVGSGGWSPEGVIVFGGRGLVAFPMQQVSDQGGGMPTAVLSSPGSLASFLPDGRRFLYNRNSDNGWELLLGSLDVDPDEQSSEVILTSDYFSVWVPATNAAGGNVFFMRGGALMAQALDPDSVELVGEAVQVADSVSNGPSHGHFSASATGAIAYRSGLGSGLARVVWLDRSSRELEEVSQIAAGLDTAISPDDRWAAVRDTTETRDIVRIDLDSGAMKLLTVDPAADTDPEWSPDGRVVFRSARSGNGDLYQIQHTAAAGSETFLYGTEAMEVSTDWSRDGRFILFDRVQDGISDIWALPVDAEGHPGEAFAVVETPNDETAGQFSRDGNWIAYQQTLLGMRHVYVQPFRGGFSNVQIVGEGVQPYWGPDGSSLSYVSLPNRELVTVPIELPTDTGRLPTIGPTEETLPVSIAPLGQESRQQYAISQDGRVLLVPAAGSEGEMPITVILNWNSDAE